jgi:hypothetical protein
LIIVKLQKHSKNILLHDNLNENKANGRRQTAKMDADISAFCRLPSAFMLLLQ